MARHIHAGHAMFIVAANAAGNLCGQAMLNPPHAALMPETNAVRSQVKQSLESNIAHHVGTLAQQQLHNSSVASSGCQMDWPIAQLTRGILHHTSPHSCVADA